MQKFVVDGIRTRVGVLASNERARRGGCNSTKDNGGNG